MKNILKNTAEGVVMGIARIAIVALIIPVTLIVVAGGMGAALQHPIKEETENENTNT